MNKIRNDHPMKVALICGISGQDGLYLTELLLSLGYVVFGTSRDVANRSFENLKVSGLYNRVQLLDMNILDKDSVNRTISAVNPNEIYNLSGLSSVAYSFVNPVEAIESIAVGTLYILDAIRNINPSIRFYNAGSSECFGESFDMPADENTPFRPRSPYAVAKTAAFWEIANYREAYDLFACTGILFNHESPIRPDRFVTGKIISAAKRIANGSNERLSLGNIDIVRDWGWAPDYVTAMHMMLNQDCPEDYLIATGESNSLEGFLQHTFEILDLNWKDHVDVDHTLYRPNDLRVSRANPKKASDKLGWEATYKMRSVIELMLGQIK